MRGSSDEYIAPGYAAWDWAASDRKPRLVPRDWMPEDRHAFVAMHGEAAVMRFLPALLTAGGLGLAEVVAFTAARAVPHGGAAIVHGVPVADWRRQEAVAGGTVMAHSALATPST